MRGSNLQVNRMASLLCPKWEAQQIRRVFNRGYFYIDIQTYFNLKLRIVTYRLWILDKYFESEICIKKYQEINSCCGVIHCFRNHLAEFEIDRTILTGLNSLLELTVTVIRTGFDCRKASHLKIHLYDVCFETNWIEWQIFIYKL